MARHGPADRVSDRARVHFPRAGSSATANLGGWRFPPGAVPRRAATMKTNETMKTNTNPDTTGRFVRGAQRAARATTVIWAVATLAGCEVLNPGLVEDEFLDHNAAYEAMLHGAAADIAMALNELQLLTGHAAREIFSTGQGGPGGYGAIIGAGNLREDSNLDDQWDRLHSARWIAEDALERFANPDNEAPNNRNHVQAYLWAGYANERLGE